MYVLLSSSPVRCAKQSASAPHFFSTFVPSLAQPKPLLSDTPEVRASLSTGCLGRWCHGTPHPHVFRDTAQHVDTIISGRKSAGTTAPGRLPEWTTPRTRTTRVIAASRLMVDRAIEAIAARKSHEVGAGRCTHASVRLTCTHPSRVHTYLAKPSSSTRRDGHFGTCTRLFFRLFERSADGRRPTLPSSPPLATATATQQNPLSPATSRS